MADLDQSGRLRGADKLDMEWQPIATAPFDRDLELLSSAMTAYMRLSFHAAAFSANG
jgi:hypothetical protein